MNIFKNLTQKQCCEYLGYAVAVLVIAYVTSQICKGQANIMQKILMGNTVKEGLTNNDNKPKPPDNKEALVQRNEQLRHELYLTGVHIDVGETATDFEHLPHDVQLDRCMRYAYVHNNNADSFQQLLFLGATRGGTNKAFYIQHPRPMRDTPSITLSGEIRMINITQTENVDADDTLTVGGVTPSIVGQNADEKGCNIFFNGAISGMTDTANTAYLIMFQKETDNKLTFDAEL